MRHRRRGRKLGRNPNHQRALLRNLASALILTERDAELDVNPPKVKGRIVTTLSKAKEVRPLLERIAQELSRLLDEEEPPSPLPVVKPRPLSARFSVSVSNDVYRVSGERLEAFAEMMPLDQEEGWAEFWRRLTRWGVVAALRRAGITPGAKVRLGRTEVEWEG